MYQIKKIGIALLLLFFSYSLFGQGQEGMKIMEENSTLTSDGSRIYLAKEAISLTPPEGWIVKTNVSGITALIEMPKQKGERMPRTIQLQSFSGGKYIDAATAKAFAAELEKKFMSSNASISDYRLRSNIPVNMENGEKAWLFYYGFSLAGLELMHAHLLASSANRHYVLTYTDLGENFYQENVEKEKDYLGVAWASMASLQLSSKAPERLGTSKIIGFVLGIASLLGFGFAFVKKRYAGKVYSDYAEGKISTGFATSLNKTRLPNDEQDEVEVIVHTSMDEADHDDNDLNFDDADYNVSLTQEEEAFEEKKIG